MLNEIQQIIQIIDQSQNILIVFDKSWNGDAVGSALALGLFLEKIGKRHDILADSSLRSDLYSFLPGHKQIKGSFSDLRSLIISLNLKDKDIEKIDHQTIGNRLDITIRPKNGIFSPDDISFYSSKYKYDLVITLGSPDLESLGKIYENNPDFFYKIPVINIDNDPANENFAHINLLQLTSTSVSEIVMDLINSFSEVVMDEDIATCLLSGMIVKTKSFKSRKTSSETLSNAARLISIGGRREEIVNYLYRSRSLNVLKLWGRVLARVSGNTDKKIVWSIIPRSDFEKTSTDENDLFDIIDEIIVNIPQAKIIILFYEKSQGDTPLSAAIIFTSLGLNLLETMNNFHPKGTKNFIMTENAETLDSFRGHILDAIESSLKQYQI